MEEHGPRRTLVLALLIVVAACGGTSGDGGGDGGAATTATVEGTEFEFDPASMTVAADTNVTITFENAGAIEHNWALLEAGTEISSEDEFSEDLVVAQITGTAGGSSGSTTFSLPAGKYQVICTITGHFTAGMEGSLTISSG